MAELSTTDDAFLGGRLQILQARNGLRAGVDAVFLAAAVPLSDDAAEILDVGTGCGVVGLCALHRGSCARLTALDINPDLIALARRNAERNKLGERSTFHTADVRRIADTMDACALQPNSFDHVFANPPFFESGTVQHAPDATKDRANVMAAGDLDLWVRFMTHTAKAGASFTMVHKTSALPDLLRALEGRFGDLCVFPLFPRAGAAATRVLVQGRKGSRAPVSLLPGLVLHNDDGGFTADAERVLRHGAKLPLRAETQ